MHKNEVKTLIYGENYHLHETVIAIWLLNPKRVERRRCQHLFWSLNCYCMLIWSRYRYFLTCYWTVSSLVQRGGQLNGAWVLLRVRLSDQSKKVAARVLALLWDLRTRLVTPDAVLCITLRTLAYSLPKPPALRACVVSRLPYLFSYRFNWHH